MAIRINDNGKVSVRVVIDTELTEEQIVTAVAYVTAQKPSMGSGKYQRGSDDWPKKAEIIKMIDDAVEAGAREADLAYSDDFTDEAVDDAMRRARNVIMRSFPDLLMG